MAPVTVEVPAADALVEIFGTIVPVTVELPAAVP
jgi:hypothetical protein